ncbi:MAG: hypothetical protein IT560_14960 [Alphaproteobacteria bacterium]|nr:hypothetical protein [Alphaproteobacteria bacterium]
MPSYLGVHQRDVVASIGDTLALLETYSIGPAAQAQIDALRATDPATGKSKLGAIASALDDMSLIHAVKNSGVTEFFGTVGEVLQFHAQQNTDNKGTALWQSLMSWNAFGNGRMLSYTDTDAECDSWLAANRAKVIPMTQDSLDKIHSLAHATSKNPDAISNALVVMTAMVSVNHAGGDVDGMKHLFLNLSLHERHIVNKTFAAITQENAAPIHAPGPYALYGVVIDDMTSGKIGWDDESLRPLVERTAGALAPFYQTNEVQRFMIGRITPPEASEQLEGFLIIATRRAGQAVANALPEFRVIDHDGIALPATSTPQPKPGSRFSI